MKTILFITAVLLFTITSCKKAVPVRASEQERKNKEEEKKDISAIYELVEYGGGWIAPRQNDEIGFKMSITFKKDMTFKKEKIENDLTNFLRGTYKDTMVNNQSYVILQYDDAQQQRDLESYDVLWDNVWKGKEILYKYAADTLVSSSGYFDGTKYKYKKTL